MTVCPGCCFISAFDAEPNERPPDLGVEDYFKAAQEEKPLHTCMSNALEPLPTASLPEGSFWTDDRAALQLFTCFLDGVGVDASVDKALDCLVSGAERGITGFQSDLPVLFNMFQRPLPRQIPLRKWMMNGVFLGNFDGSSKLLAQSEPHLFEIARQARLYAYNGISFLTKNIELQPNAAELPSGYSILHMAAGSIEEPLDYIRRLCAPSAWKKFKSILVKRADRKGEVLDVDITCNDGDTPLLVACRAQRRRVIDLLLTLGASVTRAAYSSKDTPLHWLALMYDSKAFIERIINRGANIDAVSERCLKNPPWIFGGLTNLPKIIRARGSPLLWAVTTGNVENAGCLVELGANIDLAHPEGFTPLEAAVFMGRPEIVKVLLRKVSPSYVISRRVFSKLVVDPTLTKQCIEQHSEADQVEIVKLLTPFCPRESLEEVYEFFKFSIKHAVKGLGYALVEEILLCLDKCSTACGAVSGKPLDDDAWRRWTLSLTAVQRHDTRILGTVLRFGAHLHPETLHTLASDGGNTECIPILLEHGARLDSHNLNGPFTSFGFAVLYGNIDVAESLRGHMTAEQLGHALGRATYGGLETKSGRRLTLLGAIISFLHVSYEHIKGVEYLFTLPPELDACNFIVQLDPPFSALQLVLDDFNLNEGFFQEFSGLPLFRFLLSKFSEPHHLNATDSTGYAALHSAAWLAKPEECELLVEAGADINLMAEENRTPLDCCFLFPPRGMGIREGGLGPTREMIRRFEENRNACAVYLRSRGARSGIFEISKDSTMEEFRLPFPEKWSSANYATHQM